MASDVAHASSSNETTTSSPEVECLASIPARRRGPIIKPVTTKRGLLRHVLECEFCGKEFMYRSKYAEHRRIHTREKPFECEICLARFTQRSSLKCHIRIHTDARPYVCSQCPKAFRANSQLIVHMRVHAPLDNDVGGAFHAPAQTQTQTVQEMAIHEGHEVSFHGEHEEMAKEGEVVVYTDYTELTGSEPVVVKTEHVDPGEEQEHEQPTEEETTNLTVPEKEVELIPVDNDAHESGPYFWAASDMPTDALHEAVSVGVEEHVMDPAPESEEPDGTVHELRINRTEGNKLEVNGVIVDGTPGPEGTNSMVYSIYLNTQMFSFMYDFDNNQIKVIEEETDDYQQLVVEEDYNLDAFPTDESATFYEVTDPIYEQHVVEEFVDPSLHQPVAEEEVIAEEPMQVGAFDPSAVIAEDAIVQHDEMGNVLVTMPNGFDKSELITVPKELIEYAGPQKLTTKPTTEKKAKEPKNLDWVISAVSKGVPLHEATPHRRKKPTVKTCEYCGLFLKYPSKIAAHMRQHTGEKPYECQVCNATFALNTTLRYHMRRHFLQKCFTCMFPGCQASFINNSLLNFHFQRNHIDATRKFACLRLCGAVFASNGERQRHEATCDFVQQEDVYDGHQVDFPEYSAEYI